MILTQSDDISRAKANCVDLSNAFAFFLDRRDYEALADLFVEDGVWTRYGIDLRGRRNIVAELDKRPANQFTRHVTVGHHFTEVTDERAAAMSTNVSFFSFHGGEPPFPVVAGDMIVLDFEDVFAKTSAGWRFVSRTSHPLLVPDALWHVFTGQRLPAGVGSVPLEH